MLHMWNLKLKLSVKKKKEVMLLRLRWLFFSLAIGFHIIITRWPLVLLARNCFKCFQKTETAFDERVWQKPHNGTHVPFFHQGHAPVSYTMRGRSFFSE